MPEFPGSDSSLVSSPSSSSSPYSINFTKVSETTEQSKKKRTSTLQSSALFTTGKQTASFFNLPGAVSDLIFLAMLFFVCSPFAEINFGGGGGGGMVLKGSGGIPFDDGGEDVARGGGGGTFRGAGGGIPFNDGWTNFFGAGIVDKFLTSSANTCPPGFKCEPCNKLEEKCKPSFSMSII